MRFSARCARVRAFQDRPSSYALAKRKPRKLKRLYDKRHVMMATLKAEFDKANG